MFEYLLFCGYIKCKCTQSPPHHERIERYALQIHANPPHVAIWWCSLNAYMYSTYAHHTMYDAYQSEQTDTENMNLVCILLYVYAPTYRKYTFTYKNTHLVQIIVWPRLKQSVPRQSFLKRNHKINENRLKLAQARELIFVYRHRSYRVGASLPLYLVLRLSINMRWMRICAGISVRKLPHTAHRKRVGARVWCFE